MNNNEEQTFEIVAVGAHPDDLEITCGGTLAKLASQSYRVAIIDLTTGEPTPRGTVPTRMAEAEAAGKILGVQARFQLELPNRELMDTVPNRYALATLLRKLKPEILLGTFGRTPGASPDHYQAQLLIEAARFYSQLSKWNERFDNTPPHRIVHLAYAPFPFDAEVRQFPGSFTVDITDTMDKKLEAVKCYQSQFDEPRFEKIKHTMVGLSAAAGAKCGFSYGEVFHLPVPVGSNDFAATVRGGKGSPAPVKLN